MKPARKSRSRQPAWRRRRVAFLVFLVAAGLPAAAREDKPAPRPLVVVSDDNYPPYIFRDAQGRLMGILPDQWTLWQQKTGVPVDLQAMNWAEALHTMQEGRADVIDTIFRTPEREKVYDFTAPYARIEVPVFAHHSLGGIADIASLRGFTIGAKAGDAVIDRLRAEGIESITEYPSYEAIIQAAKNDEIKVFTVDEPPAIYYLYKYDLARSYRQSFVLYTGEFHRAVMKDRPEVLALLQKGFSKISPREYRAINQKWMGTPFLMRDTFRSLLPLIFLAACIVSLLVAGNFVLRQRVRARTAELQQAVENLRQSLVERQKTAQQLRASREYLASIFDAMNDGIFIHDAETFALVDVNHRVCEMYGFSSRQEALAADFRALSAPPPYSMAEAAGWLRKTKAEGPQTFEWRARHCDGHLFWVETSIRHVNLGPDGRLIVTVRDIGERKKAEEERQRYERRLQETQRLESLGLLAGGLAHDFNNLLAAILGNMELALMALPDDCLARDDIQAAIASTKGAADLVQQMLDYSGKGRFLVEAVDVSAVIRETIHLLHGSIAKNARVDLRLTESLPRIEADATQVRQVVMNLVINASESLQNRPGMIDIASGVIDSNDISPARLYPNDSLPPGSYVYIEVCDNGIGIPPDVLDKIYDPFYTTKFIGRGLGLSVVLGIIRAHKGAIQVDSTPGKGTTFRVFFPPAPLPPRAELPAEPGPAPAEWSGAGRFLLLVDDDPGLLDTGAKLLTRLGFQVLCATDGQHAIHLFRAQAPHIAGIILDLTMPHIDGAQALAELRGIRADVPVIVSSGHSEPEVMHRFAGLKLDGFLRKPYTLEGLRNTLGHLLPS